MSATTVIYQSSTNEKGIKLPNGSVGRRISLPPTWKRLGVSLLYNLTTGSNVNVTGTPRFSMGLTSGSQLIGDANIGHWYGFQTNAITMTYGSASVSTASYYSISVVSEYKIINNTSSFGSDLENSTGYFMTNENPLGMALLQWVVYRDGTSYNQFYGRHVSDGTERMTYNKFLLSLQSTAINSLFTNWLYGSTIPETITESTNGYFDTINVAWNREHPDPEFIIWAIGVSIFA
jgi:hypothetical protein